MDDLLKIALPIIGAGIGFWLRHIIEKRKELLGEVNKERRALYQKFADLVVDILKSAKDEEDLDQKQKLIELFEFYKKYILYASPNVINRFSDYFQYLYLRDDHPDKLNHKLHFRKLTSILRAMRKDLGLKNKGLGDDGVNLVRAIIRDFDTLVK